MTRDSYGKGFFIGLVWAAAAFFSFSGYQHIRPVLGPVADRLQPPAFQLLLLGLSLILFRFLMVRWKMTRTGKGMLLVIFGATLIAYLNSRYKFL